MKRPKVNAIQKDIGREMNAVLDGLLDLSACAERFGCEAEVETLESMRDHLIDHVWPVLDEEAREGGAEGLNQKRLAAELGVTVDDDGQA